MVRLLQSHAVTLDGTYHFFDGFVLGNDLALQFLGHAFQTDAFFLGHTLHRHTGHHAHYVSHLLSSDLLSYVHLSVQPLFVQFLQLTAQHGLTVTVAGCQLKILVADGLLLLLLHLLHLLLLLCNLRGDIGILQVHPRTGLVQGINGFVRHKTVTDITVCQSDTRL